MEKVSREHFMNTYNGKLVSLIGACIAPPKTLAKIINHLNDTDMYQVALTTPVDSKFTGVFHRMSHGFYRTMASGENSYKDFAKGSYIFSDDKISIIVTPSYDDNVIVTVYRIEQ